MKTVLLNNEQHRDLRVDNRFRRENGDAVMWGQTFSPEFRTVQAHYPILFQKDPNSGRFFAVALFGLEQEENLFLQDDRWDAGYIPLMMQRVPFSIGTYPGDDGDEPRRMMHIDVEHPKVNTETGTRLFEEHGANTDYLDRVSGMLEAIHVWHQHDIAFIDTLTELQLLEPVTMDITLEDGTTGQLMGFYTIQEERLKSLSAEQVASLHERGYLEPIYMAIASMGKMRALIERKSRNHHERAQ